MFEDDENCSVSTLNTSNLSNKNQDLIQLSLRPFSLIKPFDLNPLKILNFMKNEIIYNFSPKKVILSNLEEIKRKNLILSMKKFLIKYNFEYKTLFIAVYFMDLILFKLNNHSKDLDSIAIGCLILAAKFYDKNGKIPNLNFFQEILPNYSKFSIDELREIEIFCLIHLNYDLNFPQPLNFIEILLLNGIVFTNDLIYLNINSKIYNLPYKIYEKIILANADYLKFNPLFLAFGFIAVSRKLFSLEKWNPYFNSIFDVSFEEIENIYNEIPNLIIKHEQIKNNNNNILIYEKKITSNNIYNKMKNKNILNQAFSKTSNNNSINNNNNSINNSNKNNIIYKANKNIYFINKNNINNNNVSYKNNNNKITSYTYSKNTNNYNSNNESNNKIKVFKNKINIIKKNKNYEDNLNKSTKDLTSSDSNINLHSNFTNYRQVINYRNSLFKNAFNNNNINNSFHLNSLNYNSNENENSLFNKNKTCTLYKNKYSLNTNTNNNNNNFNESFEINNCHSTRENLEENNSKNLKKNNDSLNNNSFLKNFKNYQIKGIPYYTKKISAAINLKKHILSINYHNNNNEKLFSTINL